MVGYRKAIVPLYEKYYGFMFVIERSYCCSSPLPSPPSTGCSGCWGGSVAGGSVGGGGSPAVAPTISAPTLSFGSSQPDSSDLSLLDDSDDSDTVEF